MDEKPQYTDSQKLEILKGWISIVREHGALSDAARKYIHRYSGDEELEKVLSMFTVMRTQMGATQSSAVGSGDDLSDLTKQ
ncbi:MAG TPA: hypothetical protein VJJ82_01680 [Candidatus Nanoarchaeia archaeon]|nr:hypothetical protein [Candidatus Nanoarchaeia archaeon]